MSTVKLRDIRKSVSAIDNVNRIPFALRVVVVFRILLVFDGFTSVVCVEVKCLHVLWTSLPANSAYPFLRYRYIQKSRNLPIKKGNNRDHRR